MVVMDYSLSGNTCNVVSHSLVSAVSTTTGFPQANHHVTTVTFPKATDR